jgi:substrate import-associated zinc metallohydrolase lipoprotein
MKQAIKLLLFVLLAVSVCISCRKDQMPVIKDTIDYFNYGAPKNDLDSLIDSVQQKYGVRIIYEFDPRVIDPTTFFVPPVYDQAKAYAKNVVEKTWLEPISIYAPEFGKKQLPIEFLEVGTGIHFNVISSGGSVGAGLNAQYYRLGIGGVDDYSFSRAWIRENICIVYHEHAHQLDQKYGRPKGYDQVSQGTYYDLEYQTKTDEQAQLDGFFRAYGGYQAVEDFATTVEAMIRFPKDSILRIVAKNPKLATKYQMVNNFYLTKGIDLSLMQTKLDSTVNAFVPNP